MKSKNYVSRWISAWLDRHGLTSVADVVDLETAQRGDVTALHDMARRAIAGCEWERAIELLQGGLLLAPADATLHCSLGAAYRGQLDFEQARAAYERALTLRPVYLEAFINLGEWCFSQAQHENSLGWLEKALSINPRSFEARLNQTAVLFELGRISQALSCAERLVADEPDRAEPHLNLGNILLHNAKGKLAIKQYLKALELQPGYPEASFNLASLVGSQADLGNAIGYLERRIKDRGASVQNLGLLASAYHAAGQIAKSEDCCRRILSRQADNMLALLTLANCCSASGNVKESVNYYRQVHERDPLQWVIGSNFLFESTNLPTLSREGLFDLHRAWADRVETGKLPLSDFANRDRNPARKLRIGYVSGDFVSHPVGFLLRDILKHHDAENFSVNCFSMAVRPQEVLPELREAADSWEDIFLSSDEEVAKLISDAEIDILIDLTGHTALHRLLTFAMKPAPVQAEWIGYFHSTGMRSIDYFITDPYTTPRGGGQMFSETPVHLPQTRFCYSPPDYAPDVVSSPLKVSGHVTFGSFNRLSKLTDEAVAAWSGILSGVPGSRLVMKAAAFTEPLVVERIQHRFAAHGIATDRLELRENSPHGAMLAQYGDMDIALDTFPFNGGMTTMEALWMGVPVVTIAGNTVVSRQTVSVLANIGLADELAFTDVAAYVEGAIRLAQDTDRLANLRTGMRERMMQSPLRNAPQFTRDLEALLRRMWVAWCNGTRLPSDIDS